ncbi:MAG: hypothetical protein K6E19_10050 [Lachnospiraceae bacterium]|nr:hypothetical protein [Lachnospiraceae bacterium]
MKYTTDEALNEVLKRGQEMKSQHERKLISTMATIAGVLTFALIGTLGYLVRVPVDGSGKQYGSFILSSEAGGYVLVAVLAFVLGIAFTILVRLVKKNRKVMQ